MNRNQKMQLELGRLLNEEKVMMSQFYERMSGHKQWEQFRPKQRFVEVMECLSEKIKTIQGELSGKTDQFHF